MNRKLTIERLSAYAVFLRSGRSLEITEELINLLFDILSYITVNNREMLSKLQEIFSAILQCQETEDWLGMADYLEYELKDYLKSL